MRHAIGADVQGIDRENHRITLRVSGPAVARDELIILPEAYERDIASYLRAPAFLWMHPLTKEGVKDPKVILGRGVEVWTQPDGLFMTLEYAVRESTWAKDLWNLTAGGYARSFSIYGNILQSVTRASAKGLIDALPSFARDALMSGVCKGVVTRFELMEVSQVVVGSDRDAIIEARAAGLITEEAVARMFSEQATERSNTVSAIPPSDVDTLEPAAREASAETTHAATPPVEEAQARMPVRMMDVAARLRGVADCLDRCRWYDEDEADRAETLDGCVEILAECSGKLQAERADGSAGRAPVPTPEAAPEPQAPTLADAAFLRMAEQSLSKIIAAQ